MPGDERARVIPWGGPDEPDWGRGREPAPQDVVDQVRHDLGIGTPRVRHEPRERDVSGLRRELGI